MGHSGKIGCIDWRADDSGFCDGCTNGLVAFYDLQQYRTEQKRCDSDFQTRRSVAITSCAVVDASDNRAIVANADRKLFDTAVDD